jgi:Cu2+-exporting ATPase
LPEEKHAVIKKLQAQGRIVWAVGDGINDAPQLAQADVSVAVASGAPLAQAGADIVLTANSLLPLAAVIKHARLTRMIIRQNLAWAFVYNIVAIPVAAMGLVNPWLAGIGMALSSLAVTLNAWRLRRAT